MHSHDTDLGQDTTKSQDAEDFAPVRTAKESFAIALAVEPLMSDFDVVRECGSWRS
ncbi:MAG: hypothetical protein H6716_23455 [Polyangiaceae bacterium]|nr:hypothetical protein [Polyangiaceae bacterium]